MTDSSSSSADLKLCVLRFLSVVVRELRQRRRRAAKTEGGRRRQRRTILAMDGRAGPEREGRVSVWGGPQGCVQHRAAGSCSSLLPALQVRLTGIQTFTVKALTYERALNNFLSLCRFYDYGKSPSPSSSITSSNGGSGRFDSRVPDVATVPEHDPSKQRSHDISSQHLPGPQDYNNVLNMAPASKPGVIGHPIYGPYGAEQPLGQWSGPGPAQYPPPHHLTADYTTQAMHHGYHHGNVAEWSQYPLFPYSCW